MIGNLVAMVMLSAPATNVSAAIAQPESAQLQTHIPRNRLPLTVRAAITVLDTACRARGGRPGKSPDLVQIADLNSDRMWDYVIDANDHDCLRAPAAGDKAGAALIVYFGGPSSSATQAYSATVRASRILPVSGRAVLSLTDDAECGKPDAANLLNSRWGWCRRLLYWRPAKQAFELTRRPWPGGPGSVPYMRKDYAEAARLFTAAVDMGDVKSMQLLGTMYRSGYGVPKDMAKAVALYRRAAQAGDRDAMFALGNLRTLFPEHVSDEEAALWRKRRAETPPEAPGEWKIVSNPDQTRDVPRAP